MKNKIATISIISTSTILMWSQNAFAQSIIDPDKRSDACRGVTGSSNCATNANFLNSLLGQVINLLSLLIGAIAVIMLIVGALRYVVSGGDANATKGAKDTILYAIIGLVIAILAQVIIRFVIGQF